MECMRLVRHELLAKLHGRPALALILGVVFAGVAGMLLLSFATRSPESFVSPEVATNTPSETETVTESALPARLRIPHISVDAAFGTPLGLTATQEVEVPEDDWEVGWYQYGPRPGEIGPAVVLGHVDSYLGPAVFYPLGQLVPGDRIYIDRADGTTVTFAVTALERYPQSDFPTAAVYGDIDHAGLRLVTCSGIYDRGVARYTHNLVVYAKLVEET